MSCVVTGVNVLFTFVPIFAIERLGRRKLLLGSLVGVFTSLIVLGGGFLLINGDCPIVASFNASAPANLTSSVRQDLAKCQAYQ